MMAYVASEGRLFALKPSEWGILLGGVALCGSRNAAFLIASKGYADIRDGG